MNVELIDGSEFEIHSMSRADYSAFVEVEAKAADIEAPGRDRIAKQQAMINREQDRIMANLYDKDMVRLAESRDFIAVWRATLIYSVGGEAARGNSSGSGSGDTTQTD